ncbi:MAG: A/G-specific adenine glycosylase [Spirochaetales bacterium]|nr:A/G-specific adenine glycosylase [Spirochaetales bacterium]
MNRFTFREYDVASKKKIENFRRLVWEYYRVHGRDMPWRRTRDPYRVLVSEFMLQQTQVERVKKKYPEFLKLFPNVSALARAPLPAVLSAWQGLGYNRRARNLLLCAREIVRRHGGKVPWTEEALLALPGVGRSTAGAVLAFAYNLPSVFIETNVRAAFIDFFFPEAKKVSDREIIPLVEAALDARNPREWYFALFDYGVHLKSVKPGVGERSAQYKKQSKFEGSRRQIRGAMLRLLTGRRRGMTFREMAKELGKEGEVVRSVLEELEREGFLRKIRNQYVITDME